LPREVFSYEVFSYPDVDEETGEPEEVSQALPVDIQEFCERLEGICGEFFEKDIVPLLPKLSENGTLEPIMKILVFLSEKGNIPSVVSPYEKKDREYTYALLKHISLAEHSINTARIGMEMLKKELPFLYEITPDKYLVLFLGHDLGKAFAGENYSTQDHPVISARVLAEIIPDDVAWKEAVIEAVKNHHLTGLNKMPQDSDKFDLWLLQTADRKAREKEIQKAVQSTREGKEDGKLQSQLGTDSPKPQSQPEDQPTPQTQPQSHEKTVSPPSSSVPDASMPDDGYIKPYGITPAELFKKILPLVIKLISAEDYKNLPVPPETPEGNFVAESQPDGIVYIRPDVIYHAFLLLVKEKGLERENAALLAKPKNEALREIVYWLIENNCIAPKCVKPGYFGRWYAFELSGKEHKALFTPVLINVFGVLPGEIEKVRRQTPKVSEIKEFKKVNK